MRSFRQTIKSLLSGVALALYATAPVHADDIEIYTSLGGSATTVQPNVLFVLDSSGSMNEPVVTAQTPYDPLTTYSGCYNSGRVYYSTSGSTPSCNSRNYFYETALQCDHAFNEYDAGGNYVSANGPLDVAGYYTGQLSQYRSRSWTSISTRRNSYRSYSIECAQDQGVHGSNASPTPNTYIVNRGPYQSSPTSPFIWASGGSNYTIYHYNYLNYLVDPTSTTTSTRFEEMKKAILALTDANTNINIALMQYDSTNAEGGPVIYAMEDINAARNDFQARVKTMNAGGATPLAETYYEALRYFGGNRIDYGATSNPSTQTGAKENGNPKFYETPIEQSCQKHAIVYLTDGAPTYDHLSTSRAANLSGFSPSGCTSNASTFTYSSNIDDSCLDLMAGWAANNDIASRADITAHNGEQNLTTYTIGFDMSSGSTTEQKAEALLRRTAIAGGGSFFEAENAGTLSNVFSQIISEILAVNSTFSSPAVSVNAFNRATNLDDLYFTLFKPAGANHWDGNLKKYKLDFDVNNMPFIADQTGVDAIDPSTGFFSEQSVSFWTSGADAPDGNETADGGAAGELTNMRNVFTYTGNYTNTDGVLTAATPAAANLTDNVNALDKANAIVDDAMLGTTGEPDFFPGTPYRDTLLDWAYGIDVFDENTNGSVTDARRVMGDPLHAEPALVQYGITNSDLDGNGDDDPDLVAYVATNDGYLHAFDTITGQEYFAFVPQELVSNLKVIFEDNGVGGKSYGLDGNVVPWINDVGRDGTINANDGDHVYIYFGQRRGGNNIYAMDVTDRTSPKLMYILQGGSGDYAEMAQTWSTINVEKLYVGGVEKTVLIFGGGYDTVQDGATFRTTDSQGRAIYIVDAATGDRLWWAGPNGSGADLEVNEMEYSFPARIKPIDINGDGITDRLYTGDMGGQLWRFDIEDGELNNGVEGGPIAELASDGDVNETRRFYYPPDVALISESGQAPYISIVASSGYRAHPLQTDAHDRLYMIRDEDIYNIRDYSSEPVITESDLFDTTNNAIGEGNDTAKAAAVANLGTAKGWYISYQETNGSWVGEKGLSEPLILDGTAIVTTYAPASAGLSVSAACEPNDGTGITYFVNVTDGTPTFDISGSTDKTREDRKKFLQRGGIPPTPNVVLTKDSVPTLCIGTECDVAGSINTIQKTFWYEAEQ